MLRDVHSKNFDDGAVVHRHPLFDSTRETNTTPRRNSEKKTKRRRTSSSSSSPPSLPLSSLVSLSSSSSLWCCLLSFDWKRLVYPKPKRRSKNVGVFCGHKNFYSFSEGESRKRPLSLFLSLFLFLFLSLIIFESIFCVSLSFSSRLCLLSPEPLESVVKNKKREREYSCVTYGM